MKPNLKLVTPTVEKQTVRQRASKNPEGRKPNAELRTREHLTPAEVETLIKTMKGNRNGHRDATMILIAYRHGLRVSELCDLQWNQIDFQSAAIHIRRVKRGTPATHPLTGNEMRALRKLKSENDASPFVFVSELGTPFTTMGFSQMLKRAAEKAGLDIKVHAHMLRHACGLAREEYSAHRPLHGIITKSVQGLLEGLRRQGQPLIEKALERIRGFSLSAKLKRSTFAVTWFFGV